jgi:hypothetical protein
MKKLTIIILCISLFWNVGIAQDPSQGQGPKYIITLKNNKVYEGYILSDDGKEMMLMTESIGKLYILKADLKSLKKIETQVEIEHEDKFITGGRYLDSGPFTTRHCITTNALPIKKGENYAMTNIYGPEVHFAVTDRLNVGIMTTWIASPLALAVKYNIPTLNPKINFSVGTLAMTSGYFANFKGYGHLTFGNVTFGDRLNNITFSAGYMYFNLDGIFKMPVTSVAGMFKVGPKSTFIFDSMFRYPDANLRTKDYSKNSNFIFVSPGMRFQSSEKFAWQLSMAGMSFEAKGDTDRISFPMPFVSLFWKF